MGVKDFLNYIISAFNKYAVPFLEIVSKKIDLYYVSLGIFAFAAISGGISLLLRLSFKKVRDSSCFNLLTIFALCFVFDLFVCLCEHEFNAKYFKTLFSAFSFCFIKLLIGSIFFATIGLETLILRKNDRKNADKTKKSKSNIIGQNAQNDSLREQGNPYIGKDYAAALYSPKNLSERAQTARVIETPSCPLKDAYLGEKPFNICFKNVSEQNKKPLSIEFLQRLTPDRTTKNDFVRPDVNVAYVYALCESLKKETVSESDRERIADIELSLKFNEPKSPEQVRDLNENLSWLIKKIADGGARIAP